jgi:hypothetical protein
MCKLIVAILKLHYRKIKYAPAMEKHQDLIKASVST